MSEPATIGRPAFETASVDGTACDGACPISACPTFRDRDTATGLFEPSDRLVVTLETDTASPWGTALYFGAPARPLFGRWHRPAHGSADLAVLLCSAHGREEASSHRTLSHIARAAASAGLHALRFDYAACGDSAGDDSLPNLFDAWLDSIDAALEELRRLSRCQRVAVVGLRLGTLLAARVAARRGDVDAFIAIAPVVSGRSYLRELRALRAAGQAPNADAGNDDGSLESGGFALTAATLAELSAVDLRKLDRPPGGELLILDRDDMPSASPWAEQLASTGVRVELESFGGFAEMMQAPHLSEVPAGLADRIARWLGAAARQRHDPPARSLVPVFRGACLGAAQEQILSLPVAGGAPLFGIVTLPARPAQSGLGLLLINAGAQGHTGPGRLYVEMARKCAALGAVIVRIDLSGLGDSPARVGSAENVVYADSAIDEVADVVRYLRQACPLARWYAAGICSGAYHAMKAAAQGAPLDGVLSINPLTFFRQPGMPLEAALPAHRVASELARYRSGPFAAHRWRKLLRGQVDLLMIGALLRQRVLLKLSAWLREAARTLHWPIKDDLALELKRHAGAGVEIRFMFAANDPGEELLRAQAGRAVDRLLRRQAIAIDRVADADHTFTGTRGRARLMSIVSDWVRTTQATVRHDESLNGPADRRS